MLAPRQNREVPRPRSGGRARNGQETRPPARLASERRPERQAVQGSIRKWRQKQKARATTSVTSTGWFNNGWKGRSARSHSQTWPRPLRASVLSNPLVVRRILLRHVFFFLLSKNKPNRCDERERKHDVPKKETCPSPNASRRFRLANQNRSTVPSLYGNHIRLIACSSSYRIGGKRPDKNLYLHRLPLAAFGILTSRGAHRKQGHRFNRPLSNTRHSENSQYGIHKWRYISA